MASFKYMVIVEIRYRWWFRYLYMPTLRWLHEFMINYVSLDIDVNLDQFKRIYKLGTMIYVNGRRTKWH